MRIKSFIVDAFTDTLFKGNQAGVCILEHPISENNMINMAKEFGFSETAFVVHQQTDVYSIRYFSPVTEIPLCGHATLASAKALFNEFPELNKVIFHTHFGQVLEVFKRLSHIEMFFPVHETEKAVLSEEIKTAIGIKDIINCEYNKEHNILMAEIESSDELQRLTPDFNVLRSIKSSFSGVLVTSLSSKPGYDFEYRYFWPWSGSDEDPATGGVQSFLCRYWALKLNKTILKAFQSSSRTGSMEVELKDKKTIIKSNAVIFLKGEIHIDV
ncbi:PhzF family phenazine biosynthesis protein [Chryseobacterium antibioticum]|uniref:PhzF family phenazine biosynthesis protein n=1 Tax=Chryseobacterium pyrolae TaxID=2987481 RepID=A0ABT2IK80_9FLAO|nr:PhzF family phenazine biosynthesis protein [Chryseobacterium pyrolae]MCT2409065.1 PhzF family phenazine biosynthesis protein [Chryseobacterium pyrolae]